MLPMSNNETKASPRLKAFCFPGKSRFNVSFLGVGEIRKRDERFDKNARKSFFCKNRFDNIYIYICKKKKKNDIISKCDCSRYGTNSASSVRAAA